MSTVTVELTAEDVELLRDVVELAHNLAADSEEDADVERLQKLHRKLRRAQQEQVYPN